MSSSLSLRLIGCAQVGDAWFPMLDCSERCVCRGRDNITCDPWRCGPAQVCGIQEGQLGCHSTGRDKTFLPPPPSLPHSASQLGRRWHKCRTSSVVNLLYAQVQLNEAALLAHPHTQAHIGLLMIVQNSSEFSLKGNITYTRLKVNHTEIGNK